uniref:Glucosamine--fructose-6-phosphate aminotransferase [isomerizing] 2 n=1 Tax=Lygus hesperus TaxID=30085 RepID=A0A0A9YWE4_LYGHE
MALEHCRQCGTLCVGVTNVVGSSISRLTDFGTHLNAGAEVGVASTKAYTSQVVVLVLIVLLLCAHDKDLAKRREEIIAGLGSLSAKIQSTLQFVMKPIKTLAHTLKDAHSFVILGRGYDYATAIEGALKVKELSYVHTEGINSGELKHGPLALVDETLPVLAICSNDKHFSKSKAAVQQVHARRGRVTVITNAPDDGELHESATEIITVPQTVDCLQCVLNVIPLQLLSYFMAL